MISEARSFSSLIPTDSFLWLRIAISYSYYGYLSIQRRFAWNVSLINIEKIAKGLKKGLPDLFRLRLCPRIVTKSSIEEKESLDVLFCRFEVLRFRMSIGDHADCADGIV